MTRPRVSKPNIVAQVPMAALAATEEYRCVIEFCAKTPGYVGFTMAAVNVAIKVLKADEKARRAFRYARGRKLVFGFVSPTDRDEFLWSFNDMMMDRDDVTERAFFTPTDLQP